MSSAAATDIVHPDEATHKMEEASETWTNGDLESGEFTFDRVEVQRRFEQQRYRGWLKAAAVVVALVVAVAVVLPVALLIGEDDSETINSSPSTTTSAMEPVQGEVPPSDTKLASTPVTTPSPTSLDTAATESSTSSQDEWPGAFPNTPNSVTINIYTDSNPEDVFLEWSVQDEFGLWQSQHFVSPFVEHTLHQYTREVQAGRSYRLRLVDSQGDGTCCHDGQGWFTLTNSTASPDHSEGTVIWNAKGDVLESFLEMYLWVDEEGRSMLHPTLQPYVNPSSSSPVSDKWPGAFPEATANAVAFNIHTDENQAETVSWQWSVFDESTQTWHLLDSRSNTAAAPNQLFSYTKEVESDHKYRLRLVGDNDHSPDEWYTVTDSSGAVDGSPLWSATGKDWQKAVDVYLVVDVEGNVRLDTAAEEAKLAYDPSKSNEQWPGAYPQHDGAVTINLFTDDYPAETTWEWSVQNKNTGSWKALTSGTPTVANGLVSYEQPVEIQSVYRLKIGDARHDGTCCSHGLGWFTVTDSTQSTAQDGVVVWSERGDALQTELVAEFLIDAYGHAHTKETVQNSYASYSSPRNSPDLP